MPHLWVANGAANGTGDASADDGEWRRRTFDVECSVGDATIVRARGADGVRWVLLGPPSLRLNGLGLATGIAVLRDRDELLIDGARAYFSTEDRPSVVAMPAIDRAVRCPRCTTTIAPGTEAVACPRCGVWHHERADRRCWTYAPVCTSCDQATAFDAPYRFHPAVLA